jgi:hypothetical protein
MHRNSNKQAVIKMLEAQANAIADARAFLKQRLAAAGRDDALIGEAITNMTIKLFDSGLFEQEAVRSNAQMLALEHGFRKDSVQMCVNEALEKAAQRSSTNGAGASPIEHRTSPAAPEPEDVPDQLQREDDAGGSDELEPNDDDDERFLLPGSPHTRPIWQAMSAANDKPKAFVEAVPETKYLIRSGRVTKQDAVDFLQLVADHHGLIVDLGQDAVQSIISKIAEAKQHTEDAAGEAPPLGEEEGLRGVTLADFHAYMPTHGYIYAPSRDLWPAASVNARILPVPIFAADGTAVLGKDDKQKTISATAWLDQYKPVEQMTWAPGMPMLIRNRLISEGGWIARQDVTTFNRFRAPTIQLGDAAEAGPWLEHVTRVFKDDTEHIIRWLAHRVQRPQEKINHALVLGGSQGIGKDTMLDPVKYAIGPWNFIEIGPQHLLGRFNGFLQSVILRVSEARDLGDLNRYQFYDHMKAYTTAPPDVLRVDEKHVREFSILNCTGVIITTNHKADGIFLPADDRRHFVAWSEATKEDFGENYWPRLWGWYAAGGNSHVAAYLTKLDLTGFDPKAPPPKTPAFWDIVDANRSTEDSEFADVLEAMGNPAATTLSHMMSVAESDPGAANFAAWIKDRKNRRAIPHRLENCGYVPVRNDNAKDGMWKVAGRRQAIYARAELRVCDRLAAAGKL